jgi:hypothetical protein
VLILCLAVGACASSTDQRSHGYGDYLAMSCDQLGQEAARLADEAAERSEPVLENRQDKREIASLQLREIKQARSEKKCSPESL